MKNYYVLEPRRAEQLSNGTWKVEMYHIETDSIETHIVNNANFQRHYIERKLVDNLKDNSK